MNIARRRFRIPALLVCLMAFGTADIYAQDDPFNTGGARQQDPQPADRGQPADATDDLLQIVRPDPVVDAIVASDPKAPFELMQAIDLLLDIDRDDLAGTYVKKLMDLQLDDEQNYNLYKQAGSARIFRVANRGGLGPEGKQLALMVLDGADRYATDATRIQQLAEAVVRNEDKYQRSLALSDLRLLGDVGAAVLIEKLVDPAYATEWARIRQAVQLFGNSAEGPLMAALQSNSMKLRVEALYLMRHLKTSDAVESLMAPMLSETSTQLQREVATQSLKQMTGRVPDARECQDRLYRAARRYLMDQILISSNADDLLKWWRWDAENRTLTPTWLTAQTVARIRGFQRVSDLVQLNRENREYQRLYWVARLESAKLTGGVHHRLPQPVLKSFANSIDPDLAREVLDQALQMKRLPAAVAACEVLGALGHKEYLESAGGIASPLARALTSGSRRLTAAAAAAIFRIDPEQSFSGSSDYLSSLVYLSRSGGSKTAIVGHVNLEVAQSVAALTSRRGYVARPATTSRGLFEQAKNDPDLELLVITDKLSRPGFSELVQAVRANSRTRHIPILLMVDPDNVNRANRLADRYKNIQVSPAVVSELVIARQIDNLVKGIDYEDATQVERGDNAVMALDHLGHYASQPDRYPFFDVVRHQDNLVGGLASPSRAASTCRVLGELGTADAQVRLLETASNMQLPVALRRIAAESFGVAVQNRGLMLSRQQILDQYARYNASADEPAESQQILASVLDVLESRAGD